MKVLVIGDIHGENVWKYYLNNNEHDHVVFIGDYFDSFNISIQTQIENFNEIVEYKKSNINKTTLLVGNHDFHYMIDDEMYSGFNASTKFAVQSILLDMVKDGTLTMVHSIGKYLFSHAGVSQKWCENQGDYIDMNNLVNSINDILIFSPRKFSFMDNTPKNSLETLSFTGDNKTQSPIWIRPKSLLNSMVSGGWHQIVGHTHGKNIMFYDNLTIVDAIPNEALLIDIETNELKVITKFDFIV